MASTAEKLDLELWEEAKADARAAYGGHSARAMQYASKLYQARGGRYRGRKRADNRLVQWTEQDWTTKSGKPSRETGERYLPRAAIESLSAAEYGATTRAKRQGGGVGSVVAQPQSIREKTRKFRKVNPIMAKSATPAQIAARKKFAERARSGELAKMRKKATRKSNPMEGGRGNRYQIRLRGIGMEKYPIASYSDLGLAKDYLDEIDRPVGTHYIYDTKTKEVFNSFAFETRNMKRNPTATRTTRSRTKSISNGREKNPVKRQKIGKIAWLSPGGERQVMEVPIDFSFKQYVGNIQEDFFARTENGFLIVTEKSTGFKVGQVPHTMRAAALNDRAAAKRFVESILERIGADKFRQAIKSQPKIA